MKFHLALSLLVIPFYWIFLCDHITVVSGLCLEDQRSLLLQLKNNFTKVLDISNNRLQSWNSTSDCCKWLGVTCDMQGHVTALDLSKEYISGGFDNSSSLFHLQHLQKLNLAYNDFNSAIPSGLRNLEKLNYLNLSEAGFVGQIPIEISQLTGLVTLVFSYLSDEFKLELPNLRHFIQNLTSIKQLYLDGVRIKSKGHEWSSALLSLPHLQELSMSRCNLSGPLDPSLVRLENLSIIILHSNNLSSSVPETFANFKNLKILDVRSCELTGTFPPKIFQIGTLSSIDISYNLNLHGFFLDFPLNGSLQSLIVSKTNFTGTLAHSIGNMRQLKTLDLSFCQFSGTLPSSLSNLTNLEYLDLSVNKFTGPIPSFGVTKDIFDGMKNLVHIELHNNFFNGSIPSSLFTLPLLQIIDLSNNQFSQSYEINNVSSSANFLDLSSNDLSGPIPSFIFRLSGLSFLYLYSNKFNGSVPMNKFQDIYLSDLDFSYNNLSFDENVTDAIGFSFPNLFGVTLVSCNLKTFPGFLRFLSSLSFLDLSQNFIQGKLPNWIWKLDDLGHLNISHNLLTELEGPLPNASSNFLTIDLHDNQLQGPLPIFAKDAMILDYSNNNFSSVIPFNIGDYLTSMMFISFSNNSLHGSIPESLCSAPSLEVLDLSLNNISGTIPPCLFTLSKKTFHALGVLNLGKNNLTGHIPNTFPTSCALETIDLSGNLLDGPIPNSLAYCNRLEVLDIGTNHINGEFPCFLREISTLRVLVLRNNKFHGPIGCPKTNGSWNMVQIVDLAFNNFSGKLPEKLFSSWKAMMYDEEKVESEVSQIQYEIDFRQVYQDSETLISKGQEIKLVKIRLAFTSIDLSYNQFEGSIPKELMDFKALHILNLTHNAFSGSIPSSIGNLRNLESLDLSQNALRGEIPVQLASLSFLSYLNLSFNHLIGRIPTGTQLQSFSASSFEGNKGLYGPPLTEYRKPYGGVQGLLPGPLPACGRLVCEDDWNFLSVELGLLFGLGIFSGSLLFWKQWRVWYWQLGDKILCWIFPQLNIEYQIRGGQSYRVLRWRY